MEEEAAEYLQKDNVQKKPVVGFIACVSCSAPPCQPSADWCLFWFVLLMYGG